MKATERISQLTAETAKKPLHRPKKKVMPKNMMLRIKDTKATFMGRLEDTVILYPGIQV
jgi:hypothetical protein